MAISVADPVISASRPGGSAVAVLLLGGLRPIRQVTSHGVALCALGLDREGLSRPLALRVVPDENEEAWADLLRSLKTSGIGPHLLLIACDGHPALLRAIGAVFPGTPVQVCIARRLRSLARRVAPKWRAACLAEARTIFFAPDLDSAVGRFRAWRRHWMKAGYPVVASLESDLASGLMFYRFPQALWSKIRTVNLVERAFQEARPAASESHEIPGGCVEPHPNGRRPPKLVPVHDLRTDAGLRRRIDLRRRRATLRARELGLSAVAVLTGLILGLALIRLL